MCLVLLRRILSSNWDDLWPAWGKETQEQFCEQLLKSASEEQSAMLRKRLADVIAEVARSTIGMLHIVRCCCLVRGNICATFL